MKTIIAQKMSGTGSIHDLASEHQGDPMGKMLGVRRRAPRILQRRYLPA